MFYKQKNLGKLLHLKLASSQNNQQQVTKNRSGRQNDPIIQHKYNTLYVIKIETVELLLLDTKSTVLSIQAAHVIYEMSK